MGILTFIPQWGIIILTGFCLYYDVFIAMLIQTWAFVAFNKVCTAQYFLWYITILPIIFSHNLMNGPRSYLTFICVFLMISSSAVFGFYAYQFEFEGTNTLWEIQLGNFYFFFVNIFGILCFTLNQRITITRHLDEDSEKVKIK